MAPAAGGAGATGAVWRVQAAVGAVPAAAPAAEAPPEEARPAAAPPRPPTPDSAPASPCGGVTSGLVPAAPVLPAAALMPPVSEPEQPIAVWQCHAPDSHLQVSQPSAAVKVTPGLEHFPPCLGSASTTLVPAQANAPRTKVSHAKDRRMPAPPRSLRCTDPSLVMWRPPCRCRQKKRDRRVVPAPASLRRHRVQPLPGDDS